MKSPWVITSLILYNSDFKMLLQHRTDDAPVNPSYWSFFGGCSKNGESLIQTFSRKLDEDLSVHLSFFEYYTAQTYLLDPRGPRTRHFFIAPTDCSPQTLRSHQREGQDLAFLSSNDLKKRKHRYVDLCIVKMLEKDLKAGKPLLQKEYVPLRFNT